jgi:F420-dependent methylenetetrahydromethanopterin dehydrogenase
VRGKDGLEQSVTGGRLLLNATHHRALTSLEEEVTPQLAAVGPGRAREGWEEVCVCVCVCANVCVEEVRSEGEKNRLGV